MPRPGQSHLDQVRQVGRGFSPRIGIAYRFLRSRGAQKLNADCRALPVDAPRSALRVARSDSVRCICKSRMRQRLPQFRTGYAAGELKQGQKVQVDNPFFGVVSMLGVYAQPIAHEQYCTKQVLDVEEKTASRLICSMDFRGQRGLNECPAVQGSRSGRTI